MRPEVRDRLFLPVVLPLVLFGTIVVLVGLFAVILLFNTREAALVLAIVAAGGVLFGTGLASSQDRLTAPKRLAIVTAALIPIVVGGLFALGVGDVPAEELNINRTPHVAKAVLSGSTAELVATEFRFEPDSGTLDAGEVEVTVTNEGQAFHTFVFEGLEDQFKLEINPGESASGTIELPPGEYVFYCDVPGHRQAGMEGRVTVQ